MIVPRQNTVAPYVFIRPPSTFAPPPSGYAHHYNNYQPRPVEPSSAAAPPTTCNRLLICIFGVIIGIVLGVAVTVPLMIAFHESKNNKDYTSITSTTNAIVPLAVTMTNTISSTTTTTTTTSSTTSTVSTTATSTTVTNTVALTLSGVQLNFDPSLLPNGWSLCYNDTYAVSLTPNLVSSILSACNKGNLMLGCGPVGNSSLTVAAMGLRSDVLYNCSTNSACTNVANGIGWYYSDLYSWGFVNNTDTVLRNSCDTASTNPNYRLCWHTSLTGGGYRCGSTTGLNSATTYARVIYHAN